jgi:protein-tyrosine phosphatase
MDLHWIDRGLAVSTRPEAGSPLDQDLAGARKAGVDILVSCLQPSEERELGLLAEESAAGSARLWFLRFRMDDGGTPGDDSTFDEFIEELAIEHSAGRRIAVHCRAGVGRSPLVAAAVLVRSGVAPAEAWRRVGDARGYPVPDNDEQRQYLYRYAARVRRGWGPDAGA